MLAFVHNFAVYTFGYQLFPSYHLKLYLINAYPYTYSCSIPQIATAALSSISEPSRSTQSHTRKAAALGRQVAKMVRNHCIVNTFVNGGS